MRAKIGLILILLLLQIGFSCNQEPASKETTDQPQKMKEMTAADILGNPEYLAISYGGFRERSLDISPSVEELKEDMKILAAMGIKILRTYKTTKTPHAPTLLKAIRALKNEDPDFEMYVMLGVWIDCENAWTDSPNHEGEDVEENIKEIEKAVELANEYPDIVKVIAVGNEAMVKWAASYFVQPWVILKWVNHLQELRANGDLPKELWITSSDNFASWGGGDSEYHVEDLEKLIKAVDFISLHTYPMHDTHYNPEFWGVQDEEQSLSDPEKVARSMDRAKVYAMTQYQNTVDYMKSLGVDKPVHIGETGWATASNGYYGPEGSKATDEYKEAVYYRLMREWTNEAGIACFYFEAFDEIWKDANNPGGSENHFGLFTIDGKAKYVVWDFVDQGVFEGLGRNGKPVSKTYNGDGTALIKDLMVPPTAKKE